MRYLQWWQKQGSYAQEQRELCCERYSSHTGFDTWGGFFVPYSRRGKLLKVIEREIQGAGSLSEAQLREVSLRSLEALDGMGPQIQWLHSYVTEDKVYCVYLAPDEGSIREHARRVGIPADRVSAVRRLLDPVNFR